MFNDMNYILNNKNVYKKILFCQFGQIYSKEWSVCHKLKFSYCNIFAIQCRRPSIFQTMNVVRSNNISLKYQRFIPSGCRDIGIRKL